MRAATTPLRSRCIEFFIRSDFLTSNSRYLVASEKGPKWRITQIKYYPELKCKKTRSPKSNPKAIKNPVKIKPEENSKQ